MSKTAFIGWRGDGFWVYDVGLGIFLKHLIDCAEAYNGGRHSTWLDDYIHRWRVDALVSDLGMNLDEQWSAEQIVIVGSLIDEACSTLRSRAFITVEEVASWILCDGQPLGSSTRGAARFPTAPVVELGLAVKALMNGSLPAPPKDTWWFHGSPKGRGVIPMLK